MVAEASRGRRQQVCGMWTRQMTSPLCCSLDNQQQLTDASAEAAGTAGLLINISVTKSMNVNTGEVLTKLRREDQENVEESAYLGVECQQIATSSGKSESE